MLPSIFQKPSLNKKNYSSQFQLLFVGKLDSHHYYKGLEVLLDALTLLPPFCRLTVVGSGSKSPYYRDLTHKLNLFSRVQFLENLSDQSLKKLYASASVLVQPSINDSEGFGLNLLEAMSQKTPVITTAASAGSSWLKTQNLALVVPPNNSHHLAAAIKELMRHPRPSLINRAFLFSQHLTPRSIAEKTLAVYHSLL